VARAAAGSPPAEPATSALLTRALDRLDARRARPTPPAPSPEAGSVPAPSSLPAAPPAAPPRGLRRLAGLAETALPLPAAARERLEEEELGPRIGRLLRREAERQGIDLSGVTG